MTWQFSSHKSWASSFRCVINPHEKSFSFTSLPIFRKTIITTQCYLPSKILPREYKLETASMKGGDIIMFKCCLCLNVVWPDTIYYSIVTVIEFDINSSYWAHAFRSPQNALEQRQRKCWTPPHGSCYLRLFSCGFEVQPPPTRK